MSQLGGTGISSKANSEARHMRIQFTRHDTQEFRVPPNSCQFDLSNFHLRLQYFIPFSFAQYCRLYGCASGYTCDTNTGYCRKFRQAYPGNVGCGVCPLGTKCDYNTGKCQPFRSSNIGNVSSAHFTV